MRMLQLRNIVAASVVILTTAGCGGGDTADDAQRPRCIGVLNRIGAVLNLSSAVNANSSAQIPEIKLSKITHNGVALDLSYPGLYLSNANVAGMTLECTLACGFSMTPGVYSFQVDAKGYKPLQMTVTAQYALRSSDGCTTTESGGTSIALVLEPE